MPADGKMLIKRPEEWGGVPCETGAPGFHHALRGKAHGPLSSQTVKDKQKKTSRPRRPLSACFPAQRGTLLHGAMTSPTSRCI